MSDPKKTAARCPSGAPCVGYDAQDNRRYCCFCGGPLKAKPLGSNRLPPWDWVAQQQQPQGGV